MKTLTLAAAKDHAAEIKDLVEQLNRACAAAMDDGMVIDHAVDAQFHPSGLWRPIFSVTAKIDPEAVVAE